MPDQALTEASVFVWSRERGLVPVYDHLLVLGSNSDCLAEIQELCEIQREKMKDCDALMAALGIEVPGSYVSLSPGDDMESTVRVIWTEQSTALDQGWLRIDPLIENETARVILVRASRRLARQLQLLKEIARKCGFVLGVVTPGPMPPAMPGMPGPGPVLGVVDYVVQPGDTMYLIAQRFGVSLDALIRANPQVRNPDLIFPGEVIHIPGAGPGVGGGLGPGPGAGPGPGPVGGRRYVVMQGDTIHSVAQKFGMGVSELIAFNPQLQAPYTLTPGQVIMIPSTGAVG